jgi:serine/threonine-protein kinase RsbW
MARAGLLTVSSPSAALPEQRIQLRIRNSMEDLALVRARFEALAASAGVPSEVVIDMNVALDEVLSNLISYGFSDQLPHDIDVVLSVGDSVVTAEIEDDGIAFDPLAAPAPDLQAPIENWPIGGLGIHLVRNLMTEVKYQRVGDRNKLLMVRRFEGSAP